MTAFMIITRTSVFTNFFFFQCNLWLLRQILLRHQRKVHTMKILDFICDARLPFDSIHFICAS